jgi:dTDP-4-amino-4,6-dideoxygalactose transaminase
LAGLPGVTLPGEREGCQSSWWLYTVLIDPEKFGLNRKELMGRLLEEKIMSRPLWYPTHRLKPFEGSYMEDISQANFVQANALSLPCSYGLTPEAQQRVIDAIRRQR